MIERFSTLPPQSHADLGTMDAPAVLFFIRVFVCSIDLYKVILKSELHMQWQGLGSFRNILSIALIGIMGRYP
jgi:hypothetical protein